MFQMGEFGLDDDEDEETDKLGNARLVSSLHMLLLCMIYLQVCNILYMKHFCNFMKRNYLFLLIVCVPTFIRGHWVIQIRRLLWW